MNKPINYISVLLVLTYIFNSDICNFFYLEKINWFHSEFSLIAEIYDPYNDAWWKLRGVIYTLCFATSFYCMTLKKTIFSFIVFMIGGSLVLGDLVTRIFTNETERYTIDFLIAIITTYFIIRKLIKQKEELKQKICG